jgi:hypothetical protein
MWKLVNQAQQAVAAAGLEEHLVREMIGAVKALCFRWYLDNHVSGLRG